MKPCQVAFIFPPELLNLILLRHPHPRSHLPFRHHNLSPNLTTVNLSYLINNSNCNPDYNLIIGFNYIIAYYFKCHEHHSITNYQIANCNSSLVIVNHSLCITTNHHFNSFINKHFNLIVIINLEYLYYFDCIIANFDINNQDNPSFSKDYCNYYCSYLFLGK